MNANPPLFRPAMRVVLVTAALLMIPLVAMQFSDEVVWTLIDFIVAGLLLSGTGLAFVAATRRMSRNREYRAGMALGLFGMLGLIWVNLAVGIIGSEDNPANAMYLAVLGIGILGALIVRLRAAGMVRVLLTMAGVQTGIAVVAIALRLGAPVSSALELAFGNALFIVIFVTSAMLFRSAAEQVTSQGDAHAS